MFIIDLDDLSGAIGSDVTYIRTQSMIYSDWGPRQSFKKWGLGIDFENQDTRALYGGSFRKNFKQCSLN